MLGNFRLYPHYSYALPLDSNSHILYKFIAKFAPIQSNTFRFHAEQFLFMEKPLFGDSFWSKSSSKSLPFRPNRNSEVNLLFYYLSFESFIPLKFFLSTFALFVFPLYVYETHGCSGVGTAFPHHFWWEGVPTPFCASNVT